MGCHNHSCLVVSADELLFLVPFSHYGAIKYNGSYKSQANKMGIAECNWQLATGELQLNIATCHLPLAAAAAATTTSLQAHLSHCVSPPLPTTAHAPAIETLNQLTPTATGVMYSLDRERGRDAQRKEERERGDHFSVCVCATAQIASARHLYTCREIPRCPHFPPSSVPPTCCGCHSWRSALAAAQTSEHIIVN